MEWTFHPYFSGKNEHPAGEICHRDARHRMGNVSVKTEQQKGFATFSIC
jgi:hypothetical protein